MHQISRRDFVALAATGVAPAPFALPYGAAASAITAQEIVDRIKKQVGVVPEDLALFDRLTAAETLTFVGRVHGLPAATLESRMNELLELMSLGGARNDLVADFSHGMRKKLSLAAALLPAPRLLFLDEPFEGIDALASRQIKDLLHAFVSRGGTVFLTSHILEIVERLCDHIGIIASGKIVAQGPIGSLQEGRAGQSLEQLFIGLVGGEAYAPASLDWL